MTRGGKCKPHFPLPLFSQPSQHLPHLFSPLSQGTCICTHVPRSEALWGAHLLKYEGSFPLNQCIGARQMKPTATSPTCCSKSKRIRRGTSLEIQSLKNPPCNAGGVDSNPGQGTKIPYWGSYCRASKPIRLPKPILDPTAGSPWLILDPETSKLVILSSKEAKS